MSDDPWQESARKHKKFVQGGADGSAKPIGNKRKNRKKWCRGKVGVAHQPVCRRYNDAKQKFKAAHSEFEANLYVHFDTWRILVCSVCGKELDWYYPFRIQCLNGVLEREQKKPEWITD